ncbi:hypothetical protein, partial [Pseudomonas aeruginosa]|uniref:hypothetical protein n=6 Tax=Pseudomonas aeruginosa TaxID=287 RepID=UPI00301DA99C
MSDSCSGPFHGSTLPVRPVFFKCRCKPRSLGFHDNPTIPPGNMSELGSLPACWFQVFRALGPGASDTTGPGAADWRSAHGSVFVVDTASGRRAPRRKRLDERAKESNLFAGERGRRKPGR